MASTWWVYYVRISIGVTFLCIYGLPSEQGKGRDFAGSVILSMVAGPLLLPFAIAARIRHQLRKRRETGR